MFGRGPNIRKKVRKQIKMYLETYYEDNESHVEGDGNECSKKKGRGWKKMGVYALRTLSILYFSKLRIHALCMNTHVK